MYFSPSVLHPGQKEHLANSYRELGKILIAGTKRQRDLHAAAIERFCRAQENHVRALAGSTGRAQLVRRYMARVASAHLEMWQMAARSGDISLDIQRQIVDLFGRCAQGLAARPSPTSIDQATPRLGNAGLSQHAPPKQMRG
jgi:hypothetical protein